MSDLAAPAWEPDNDGGPTAGEWAAVGVLVVLLVVAVGLVSVAAAVGLVISCSLTAAVGVAIRRTAMAALTCWPLGLISAPLALVFLILWHRGTPRMVWVPIDPD